MVSNWGVFLAVCLVTVTAVFSEDPPPATTPTTTNATTTLSPEEFCDKAGKEDGCDTCVKHASCLWCKTEDKCIPYPSGKILPSSVCSLSQARWGVCWMNYEALLISMGVLAGVLLISCVCCVYCCCCRNNKAKRRRRYQQEEERQQRERDERHARNEERRAERQTKYDEIRRKYGIGGLIKEDNPYKKFENEA